MIVDAPKIQSGKKICANGLTGRLSEVGARLSADVEQNPCRPDALVGISLVALASRQPEAAVKMAGQPWPPRRRWASHGSRWARR